MSRLPATRFRSSQDGLDRGAAQQGGPDAPGACSRRRPLVSAPFSTACLICSRPTTFARWRPRWRRPPGHTVVVVVLVGGHVIKTGLGPPARRLDHSRRGNSCRAQWAAAIHDFEMAAHGVTSEDVESGLADGSFGMVEETGAEMNRAIRAAHASARGYGEGLAQALAARDHLPGGRGFCPLHLSPAGRSGHRAHHHWCGDHSPAPGGRWRSARGYQSSGFPPARRIAARPARRGAWC